MGVHTPKETAKILAQVNKEVTTKDFVDSSWINDACDSLFNGAVEESESIYIYIPNKKQDITKFTVAIGEYADPIEEKYFDTVEEVISFLNKPEGEDLKLYLLFGEANILSFEDADYDEISPTASEVFEFTSLEDKEKCVEVIYMLKQVAGADYIILNEEEYKLTQ